MHENAKKQDETDGMGAARSIPRFQLYGERREAREAEFLHIETIVARSARLDWTIKPHRHDSLMQVLLVRSGGGTLTLDGEAVPFAAPWMVALPATVVHGFAFHPGTAGHVLTIAEDFFFAACAPNVALSGAVDRPLLLAPTRETAEAVDAMMNAITGELAAARPRRRDALAAWIKLLAVTLERHRLGQPAPPDPAEKKRKFSYIRFRHLVEARWREGLALDDYARALQMTPGGLNAACRRASGVSANRILHQRVMLEAKRNLIYSAMSVSEIAYDLGFAEPSYFSRVFRKETGQTPKAFRAARSPSSGFAA